ncbi:MAG TPA: substrate-binding domain-containing protein, partial [Cytophagaceae bacterium]|nr:substrate-binding domain-containing protein [Cytophagaceae bacterium]
NQFEIDNVQKAGLVPKVNQLASDALVFICSKKNPAKKISEEKIAEILKGKQDIQLVCDKSNSGNLIYLKNKFRLSGEIKQVAAAGSDSSVIEYVAGHPNAIGIIGMALVSDYDDKKVKERLSKIKLLSVQYKDSSGKLLEGYPVQEELATQNYPFIRGIFVINLDGRKNIGTGFANFMVSERGQRIILKSGLLPFYMPSRDIQINTK